MKKIIKLFLILCLIIPLVGCNKNNNNKSSNLSKNIQVVVYDKNNIVIYDENKTTSKKFLLDALNAFDDLKLETEMGDYGEFIVSINGNKQSDNYYWNYYVNDNYASVGISNYEIKDEDVLTFKLERFE